MTYDQNKFETLLKANENVRKILESNLTPEELIEITKKLLKKIDLPLDKPSENKSYVRYDKYLRYKAENIKLTEENKGLRHNIADAMVEINQLREEYENKKMYLVIRPWDYASADVEVAYSTKEAEIIKQVWVEEDYNGNSQYITIQEV